MVMATESARKTIQFRGMPIILKAIESVQKSARPKAIVMKFFSLVRAKPREKDTNRSHIIEGINSSIIFTILLTHALFSYTTKYTSECILLYPLLSKKDAICWSDASQTIYSGFFGSFWGGS